MFEAFAGHFRRSPSEYDLALPRVRGALAVVKRNVMDDIMNRLRESDPSVVLIEHEAPRDPVFPSKVPSLIWAIHFDLRPVEGIDQVEQMSWRERRKIPTMWTSRAVGLNADLGGVREAVYTAVKNGRGRWEELSSNLEYVTWSINRGIKPSDMSDHNALNYAISLAVPLGDFRYGAGYRSLDRKPRDSKYWKVLV